MRTRSGRARTDARPLRRSSRDDRGTSAVEFAIVTPVFLLLILGIIEIGLYYHARNTAQSSAREGVSVLRVAGNNADPQAWAGAAAQVAEEFAHELGDLDNVDAVATLDEETGRVTVVVTGEVNLPVGGTVSVRQSSTATLEQFRPDLEDGSP